MDNKWLSIQSFQRNQELVNDINRLLIYYKLLDSGIDDRISEDEIKNSKISISDFLVRVNELIPKFQTKSSEPFFGVDYRMKELAQSFAEAKGSNKYKSILFKENIDKLKNIFSSQDPVNKEDVILSLSELRNLLEDQISIDSKEILSDF